MKKLVVVVVVAAAVSFMAARYHAFPPNAGRVHSPRSLPSSNAVPGTPELPSRDSRCDGRTYCSQMTSCEEAKYFLNHCPNTKMDGDHDGVPCEQQWCTGG
jgi:hypothetical protein